MRARGDEARGGGGEGQVEEVGSPRNSDSVRGGEGVPADEKATGFQKRHEYRLSGCSKRLLTTEALVPCSSVLGETFSPTPAGTCIRSS